MKEAEKGLATKTEVSNALDLGDKNRKENAKFQLFDLTYFLW